MKIARLTQMAFFSIRSPRYRDRTVLLKATKVQAHNKVLFSDAPSMGTIPYYVSGQTIKQTKKEKLQAKDGHTIDVYVVRWTFLSL